MATFKTWTDYQHRINLLFHAIVAITMLPFVWLYLEIDTKQRLGAYSDPVLVILFVAICFSLIWTARVVKKRQLTEMNVAETLRKKLEAYKRVLLIHYLFLEAAAAMATLGFYLSASYWFVVIYLFILFLFSLNRPHLDRTVRDLKLDQNEKKALAERAPIA